MHLTTHRDVGKIGFTGSIPSARHIMANAAQTIKGVTLELGGNDPAIILEDAEFDAPALSRMLNATFMMSGQVCMAIKRIYVPAQRSDEFLDKFGKAVDSIVVGDGLEPSVTMGPLHSQKAQIRANGFIEDAARRGASVKPLGKIDSDSTFASGYFMRPTVVTNIADDAPLMAEEQFCPAIPVPPTTLSMRPSCAPTRRHSASADRCGVETPRRLSQWHGASKPGRCG